MSECHFMLLLLMKILLIQYFCILGQCRSVLFFKILNNAHLIICFVPLDGLCIIRKLFELTGLHFYSCLGRLTLKGHVPLPCQICAIGFFHQIFCQRILRKLDSVFGYFILNHYHGQQQGNILLD